MIICGDALQIIASRDVAGPVMVLTDPPYDERTHENALTGDRGARKLVPFEPSDLGYIRRVFSACSRFRLRWVIATMSYQHAFELERSPPPGLDFVRMGVWVKPGSAPQFSGDRPAQGWEAVAILHPPGRKHWNGGGLPAVWNVPVVHDTRWPTEKPEALCHRLLSQFADPGDTVLDPFCGSGTTIRAAKDRGMRAIGIDRDPMACQLAAERLKQEVLQFSNHREGDHHDDDYADVR